MIATDAEIKEFIDLHINEMTPEDKEMQEARHELMQAAYKITKLVAKNNPEIAEKRQAAVLTRISNGRGSYDEINYFPHLINAYEL